MAVPCSATQPPCPAASSLGLGATVVTAPAGATDEWLLQHIAAAGFAPRASQFPSHSPAFAGVHTRLRLGLPGGAGRA